MIIRKITNRKELKSSIKYNDVCSKPSMVVKLDLDELKKRDVRAYWMEETKHVKKFVECPKCKGKSEFNIQFILESVTLIIFKCTLCGSKEVLDKITEYEIIERPSIDREGKINPTKPAVMGGINGFIALLASFSYLLEEPIFWVEPILGYILLFIAIILFLGALFIGMKKYKVGAILCGIGGVLTFPIGILGLFAAKKAWKYSKWQEIY